jgi:hypothetical protein
VEIIKTSKIKIAGFLLLMAGIIGLVFSVPSALADESAVQLIRESYPDLFEDNDSVYYNMTNSEVKDIIVTQGILGSVVSIFPVLGGILTLKRKMWILAVVFGMISAIGMMLILPIILGIILGFLSLIGVIIIAQNRQNYNKNKKESD